MHCDWSEDILIVKLPAEPQTSTELHAVAGVALDRPKTDMILDFGSVDNLTRQTLYELMRLRSILRKGGRRFVFYNVSPVTREAFNGYGFDKVFEIATASDVIIKPSTKQVSCGTLELRSSDNAMPLQRRNYVRLHVPSPLKIDVLIWHGGRKDDYHKMLPGHYWHGRLVDISEGGAQVAIDTTERTTLGKGRLVGLEFRPEPTESLLEFDAQIRQILPTADGKNICLGLQFIGLEANPAGCQGLQRFCNCDGIYYEAREHTAV